MTFVLLLLFTWPGEVKPPVTNIPGFKTQQDCEVAGKRVKEMTKATRVEYTCLQQ